MKRVITYGTFDLLHWGHIRLLERAKQQGDFLIVALSTEEFNNGKGKKAYHNFEQRKMMLEALRYVDLVIPENTWGQKLEDIDKHNIDVFVMGDDWENKFPEIEEKCEVVYLARTEGVSTSSIKESLASVEVDGE